jgi:hypothetical protein
MASATPYDGMLHLADYWHAVSDVVFGLVLGYVISLVVYLQLFPFFTHHLCHVPRYAMAAVKAAGGGGGDDGSGNGNSVPNGGMREQNGEAGGQLGSPHGELRHLTT